YAIGDGKDVITDGAGADTLAFGAGITAESLAVRMVGADMIIALKEEGKTFDTLSDTITIRGWNSTANRLETILLVDGTSLDLNTLQTATEGDDTFVFGNNAVTADLLGGNDTVLSGGGNDTIGGGAGNDVINAGEGDNVITGGEGNDTLNAGSGNDVIDGGIGNDKINAGNGANTLSGGEGDDTLTSGSGADILEGGSGSDTHQGGLGNDLYLFSRGDGKDTIIDEYRIGYNNANQYNAGNDTLRFGEGITQADLIALIRPGSDDLILALREDGKTFEELGDVITIKNWVNIDSRIETIALFDGTIVDLAAIQSATEGNDNLVYGDSAVSIDALGGDDTVTTGAGSDTLHGGDGNDSLRSGGGNDALYGDAGNDALSAGSGNDILSGGEGNDTLTGETGNDTLSGNAGTDALIGGLGDDLYLFNLGDGRDTIIDEYVYGSGGNDTLRFGEGITKADLVARSVPGSNDLQIGIRESGKGFDALSDIVTLKNWFDANKRIENITLFDGTVVTLSEMQGGTDGDDYLVFGDSDTMIDAMGGNDTVITANGNDTLGGGAGNDILISNNGNDTLEGGEGNDTLKAEAGNDTLIGGTGADVLEGGGGNDTYRFARGEGKDRLLDYLHNGSYQQDGGNDTIVFGEGITKDDLVARFVSGSDDLQIGLAEAGKTFDQLTDVITITGWRNTLQRIENLRLSDGTAVSLTEIERSTAGDDYLVFSDEGVTVDALAGNDTLITGEGNDTASGGDGNDTLLSGRGNDTLTGGAGADTLKGGSGNDTYLFNRGDGADNVFDELGNDTLRFGDGITKDDLIFKQKGYDLIVGLAEINKTFDQLSDVITITDWFKEENNIEMFVFSDSSSLTKGDIATKFVPNDIYAALYSKPGADMHGGSGNDTYVYNKGDFAVVIEDSYYLGQIEANAGYDTLYLNGGINKTDITIGTVGNDLIIKVTPTNNTYEQLRDYVIIKDWANTNRGIEKIIFSNGETMAVNKSDTFPVTTFNYGWLSNGYHIYGDENNAISGNAANETFEMNGGNDTVYGSVGNDRLYGGDGNDTLIADDDGNYQEPAYADFLNGGKGDDSLYGGAGNDTYVYNRGDGKDLIYDYDAYTGNRNYISGGNDTLLFGEGISQTDLIIKTEGNNLVVALKEDGKLFADLSDKIVITDWYNANNRVETFAFSDGSSIGVIGIMAHLGTPENDGLTGTEFGDTIYGGDGNDVINAGNGSDTIYGGNGNDVIIGSNESDTLYGDNANDVLYGNVGADFLYGGDGNDTLIADDDGNYQEPAYADFLNGGKGDDSLYGGAGN
ncbi:MAG: calcium-binding protein, partial [Patescibacteria group bacterium]